MPDRNLRQNVWLRGLTHPARETQTPPVLLGDCKQPERKGADALEERRRSCIEIGRAADPPGAGDGRLPRGLPNSTVIPGTTATAGTHTGEASPT